MSLAARSDEAVLQNGTSVVHAAVGAFSLEVDGSDPHFIHLFVSTGTTSGLWSRHFGDLADRDAALERFKCGTLDLTFLARATMIFGPAAIDQAVDHVVEQERRARRERAAAEEQRQRDYQVVDLYARDTKRGFKLELQRKSESSADWSVRYDRASERDRLCDWLRWQKVRFGSFLDLAAKHGSEALTRMLIEEMFETERRIKKAGRSAGGMRPLRMWRGD